MQTTNAVSSVETHLAAIGGKVKTDVVNAVEVRRHTKWKSRSGAKTGAARAPQKMCQKIHA